MASLPLKRMRCSVPGCKVANYDSTGATSPVRINYNGDYQCEQHFESIGESLKERELARRRRQYDTRRFKAGKPTSRPRKAR